MRTLPPSLPLVIFFLLSVFGCTRQHKHTTTAIPASNLTPYLDDASKPEYWNIEKVAFNDPTDTLYSNLPYSYEQALTLLQYHFDKTDSSNIAVASKQYIKALIVADFVYAAFSFQFLGPELGLAKDSIRRWDSISLDSFYHAGNTNQTAFYCAERTSFYLRLIDTLLGLKGQPVTVEQIHTFPVVQIAGSAYIIDPYDPFVIYDTTTKTVAPYTVTQNSTQISNTIPIRTKRMFGNTRQLLSHKFVNSIKTEVKPGRSQSICQLLQTYLTKQAETLRAYVRPCFQLPQTPLYETIKHIQPGGPNAYAIEMHGRVDGQLHTATDILKYYAGINCTGN